MILFSSIVSYRLLCVQNCDEASAMMFASILVALWQQAPRMAEREQFRSNTTAKVAQKHETKPLIFTFFKKKMGVSVMILGENGKYLQFLLYFCSRQVKIMK